MYFNKNSTFMDLQLDKNSKADYLFLPIENDVKSQKV